ncbi:MAG: ABC transporter permease [Eubacterium sp.]|nr:ABC transporter permease [Eubacterium sp.]
MYKLFFIARNNIKKQKGDMITFFILTFLSTFLIFLSVSAFYSISTVFDRKLEEVNGPKIIFQLSDDKDCVACMEDAIKDNGIEEYEAMPTLNVTAEYRKKGEEKYKSYQFQLESFDEDPTIMDVLPEDLSLKENDILVPLYMKSIFAVGDTLEMKLGDEIYEFNVAGYNENPYFCSSMSISVYQVYISDEMYSRIYNDEDVPIGTVIKDIQFRCKSDETERAELDKIEKDIVENYNKNIEEYKDGNPGKRSDISLDVNWGLIGWGNQMLPSLVMAMIILFAIIILVIALVIISFSINDFIQKNMKNTGILEASGYTIKELKAALTTQLMLVGGVAVILGIGAGYLSYPGFDIFFTGLLGITAEGSKSLILPLMVAIFILLLIFVTVRMISRKYNKITVLDALRGGINTHNFKKNYFAFEGCSLPVSVVLSLKDTFGGFKKNVILCLIMVVLTISTLLGFGLMENFSLNPEGAFQYMGFEFGDAGIYGEAGHEEEIRKLEGVDNVLVQVMSNVNISYKGLEQKYSTIINDDFKYTQNTVMVEGRFPEKENELMVTGAVADIMDIKVGDVVKLSFGKTEKDYLVTGINQRMMNAGTTLTLNLEGAQRLGLDISTYNYFTTLEEGVSYEEFEKTVDRFNEDNGLSLTVSNSEDLLKSTIDGLSASMKMVCMFISILTIFIVIFVESLIIRAKISREYRGYGISKALGMTSRELVSQIALTNLPAVITGCLIGALLSKEAGKNVVKLVLSYMGIQKIAFTLSFTWIVLVVVGIIGIALITSALAGRKINKLIPVEMITEE